MTDSGPDPAFAASPSSHSAASRPSGFQSGVVEQVANALLHQRYATTDEKIAEWRDANNTAWRIAMREARAAIETVRRYETSDESADQPRVSTERLPDNFHERDCAYVTSDGPAPCTCGYYDREQAAIEERNSRCGETRPTNSAGRPEARASATRDSDGTALAALCEDIAVPQDCRAGRQASPSPNPSDHHPTTERE